MVLLKVLILTLTFNELIVNLDAVRCRKGQRVTRNGDCEDCPAEYFQDVENYTRQCKPCGRCDETSGSVVVKKCTKVSNTMCRCRGEFVRSDKDFSTCKCDIGFGLKREGSSLQECVKCENGTFSQKIDSTCQKWKDCKSAGQNRTGTTTSDVICNEDSKTNTHVTKPPTSNKPETVRLIPHSPQEGAQIPRAHTTTTTSTNPPPKDKMQPFNPSNPSSHIGMVLIFIVVGLLLLTAVICRLHITSCMKKQAAVQKNESLCRRPIEEIGEDSQTSKLNPGEP